MNIVPLMAICGLSGGLFAIGGHTWLPARRIIMPIMLCLAALYITHCVWALIILLAWPAMSLGYGEKSEFRHIFGDAWGRGVWGLLTCLCLSVWAISTGHIWPIWFGLYLVIGFFAEPLSKNLDQVIGDIIIGSCFGSIVFFIHP